MLSGTGTDGAEGLKTIKIGVDLAFAKDPPLARFDGMPRSTSSMGCVDYVLPPRQIGRESANLARRGVTAAGELEKSQIDLSLRAQSG